MNPLAIALRVLVRAYQYGVSPILPQSCRYEPSCSNYAFEALGAHGPIRGSWLAVWRVLRCHPWGGQGYDPVPAAPERAHRPGCDVGGAAH